MTQTRTDRHSHQREQTGKHWNQPRPQTIRKTEEHRTIAARETTRSHTQWQQSKAVTIGEIETCTKIKRRTGQECEQNKTLKHQLANSKRTLAAQSWEMADLA